MQLLCNLLEGYFIAQRHQRDMRQRGVFRGTNRQAFNVEAAARNKTDNALQNARLVVHQKRENVLGGIHATPLPEQCWLHRYQGKRVQAAFRREQP